MRIATAEHPPREIYQYLINAINPRPIAWVSTVSAEGVTNLAPFSFFNGITPNPPSLLFCPVNDRHGEKKDTVRNIEAVPEFTVNIVDFANANAMNATSESYPREVSEFEKCGLTAIASETIRAPRVKESPVSMECKLHQIVHIGEGPLAANLVIGLIQVIHINDAVLDSEGKIDPVKLDTIGRMGGSFYTRTRELFELNRPG